MRGERVPSESMQKPRALFAAPKPRKPKAKPEWKLQAAVVSAFHKYQDGGWNFEFAGDMNAGKRNATRAKVCGIKEGETDLRLYFPKATLRMIELKVKKGKLSKGQIERHKKLRALGFVIETVYADTEESAVAQCTKLLGEWLVDSLGYKDLTFNAMVKFCGEPKQ